MNNLNCIHLGMAGFNSVFFKEWEQPNYLFLVNQLHLYSNFIDHRMSQNNERWCKKNAINFTKWLGYDNVLCYNGKKIILITEKLFSSLFKYFHIIQRRQMELCYKISFTTKSTCFIPNPPLMVLFYKHHYRSFYFMNQWSSINIRLHEKIP